MNDISLEGKVVVITGAAGRLGRRMTRAFAEKGAAVAAVDVEGDIPFPEGAEGQPFTADLLDEAKVEACFQQIQEALGPADVLVHTVGGWAAKPLLETSLSDFEKLLQVNLTSAFLCFREAARQMEGRGGRLIGIASGQGADEGAAEQYAYSASKAGVMRLVEAAADEFEGTGITAHAIAPSVILFDGEAGRKGVPAERLVDLALYLCLPAGEALNGDTLRAYGTAR